MATVHGIGEPLEPLTYKTWVLKVSIHCQGCKRKVQKILHGVEGVYTINIDVKQHKVIVTGNVEAETLIRKLIKSGKNAELWPEPVPEMKEKKSQKSKKKEKENEGESTSEEEEDDGEDEQNDRNAPDVEKHPVKVQVMTDPSGRVVVGGVAVVTDGTGNQPPVAEKKMGENSGGAEKTGSGGKRKKKKKKGHKTVTVGEPSGGGGPTGLTPQDHYPGPPSNNLGPPSHYGYHQFPPHYHEPSPVPVPMPMYAVSYNTTRPTTTYTTSYYAAPTPHPYPTNISHTAQYCASPPRYSYGYAYNGPEVESPPSDSEYYPRKSSHSLELFSDENPNGCLIM